MPDTALSYLPCLTCLFWLVLNRLVHKRDYAFKVVELLLAFIFIASLSEAALRSCDGRTFLCFFLTRQFVMPMIIPVALWYLNTLSQGNPRRISTLAWMAIPRSLLFAQLILLVLTGADGFIESIDGYYLNLEHEKAGHLIQLCSFVFFNGILAAETLLFLVFATVKVIKGKTHIQLYNIALIVAAYAIIHVSFTFQAAPRIRIAALIILTFAIFLFAYCSLFHDKPGLTYSSLRHYSMVMIPSADRTDTEENVLQPDTTPSETGQIIRKTESLIAGMNQNPADDDVLRRKFEDLVIRQQMFLKQGIRITDIASMLDTTRTYISRLVNSTYNMSFSDYINVLRIDYACQYLLDHKDAKQSDLAAACGFPNASAFNNMFKKTTGTTPKIWLATKS